MSNKLRSFSYSWFDGRYEIKIGRMGTANMCWRRLRLTTDWHLVSVGDTLLIKLLDLLIGLRDALNQMDGNHGR